MLYNALVENYILESSDSELAKKRREAEAKYLKQLRRQVAGSKFKSAAADATKGAALGYILGREPGAAVGAGLGLASGVATPYIGEKMRLLASRYGLSKKKIATVAGLLGLAGGAYAIGRLQNSEE